MRGVFCGEVCIVTHSVHKYVIITYIHTRDISLCIEYMFQSVMYANGLRASPFVYRMKEEERRREEEAAKRRAEREERRRKKRKQRVAVVTELKNVAVQRRGEAQRLLRTILAGAAEEK